uniref:Undecaprenyl pyrophosphate synthase 1 n=1 Tax=Lygus hesperus TaxID=30085 RepID=A0A0A9XGR5_LYGHE
MGQIHLLLGGAVLITFGMRVLTMPLEEITSDEIELEFQNASSTNTSEADPDLIPTPINCYLQKNESGVITRVNITREEAGNDTYDGYEEICDPILYGTRRISLLALGSLAGAGK